MKKDDGSADLPPETREQYCERIRRLNEEAAAQGMREVRRRQILEQRLGPRLDALPADELEALARVALTGFAYRYFALDRSRAKRWLVRGPLLVGLSRMLAAAAIESERQELG